MATSATQVANMALDAIGADVQLGNIEEGGRAANVCLRAYSRCRLDLLRAAPWSFARVQQPLVLLADASGNTPNVGTVVPGTSFIYEYALPINCARIRYIPWNPFQVPPTPAGNITPANASSPLTSAQQSPTVLWQPVRPSLYLITNDPNYNTSATAGGLTTPGQSPIGNTVILSNVQNASCVYTLDAQYPSLWDGLFTSAMVAYLASEIALPIWASKNPKIGIQLRNDQIAIAKNKITEARVADGNASAVTTSHIPDWQRFRATGAADGFGGWGWGWGAGGGCWGIWGGAWGNSLSLSDGSAY